jgi:hypothetical protein
MKGDIQMIRGAKLTWLLTTAALGLAYAGPAYAQATRTWISGVGDDANPCSRTAPCKTFAGAISKTAAGGEINCIDPGGFGALTITKSITIDCKNVEAGVLISGTNGFVVQAASTDVIVIRGLDFEGLGPTALSLNGIKVNAAASVHVEDCLIRGFGSTNGTDGNGIFLNNTGTTKLFVKDTVITGNGNNGIQIKPQSGGNANVSIDGVKSANNANSGLKADSTGNTATGGIKVNVRYTDLDGNGSGVAAAAASGTNPIGIMLTDSSTSNNGTFGVVANGSPITMRVGNSTITGNATGVLAAGGSSILSYSNNRLDGNPTVGAANNGAFTGTLVPH